MHVDVNKYKRMLPRQPQEFYMRQFKDLTKYEQEVLIFREVKSILNMLDSDNDMEVLRGWGIEQLSIDLDSLVYLGDHNTKKYGEMEDSLVKSLITEATYRVSGTAVPSDVVIRD